MGGPADQVRRVAAAGAGNRAPPAADGAPGAVSLQLGRQPQLQVVLRLARVAPAVLALRVVPVDAARVRLVQAVAAAVAGALLLERGLPRVASAAAVAADAGVV